MVTSPWAALPAGTDTVQLESRLRHAHEEFLSGRRPGAVRRVVLDSWQRSRRCGVDPERPEVDASMPAAELAAYRRDHPLAALLPLARRILLDGSQEGLVVALADAGGRLLWVEGDRAVRRAVESAGFVEGALWAEDRAGTNAPGIALATDHEVQVFSAEHFALPVQPFSCSAAPVHDAFGHQLGVLDVTGRDGAAAPHMLPLVRATVAAMEAELAVRAFHQGWHRDAGALVGPGLRLDALGRSTGALTGPGVPGGSLTLRHSEILVLLAAHPRGLGADELGALLHPDGLSDVTVRAEVSRLRRVSEELVAGSRPYRPADGLVWDGGQVRELLDRGAVGDAVRLYKGPVLPRSDAPGVARLRTELDVDVRAAVEETDDVAAVLAWSLSPAGADDFAAAERLVALLPPGSPGAARARARLRMLDDDLA
ncbi:transcriptional regulator [Actinotalea sp. M2MS4P-6]|uniref:transcriptional regulator n=1 Tax=Actinotalea sp. M2MS4P-6 TaxID=2983762 RepID=UPI0021E45FEC|nr:transcriptional regulator [Actinotalea sp. M2MS4P-6]MCV2395380.1 transcriptional regulator [Actinotalea sp. M2MS4P-6]